MMKLFVIILAICLAPLTFAELLDGQSLQEVSIESVTAQMQPGSVLIVSELHGFAPHHANQVGALRSLATTSKNISVGLEFFEKPDQEYVNEYVNGQLAEADFLSLIHWGKIPFENYKQQALFSNTHSGYTLALNAPRALTSKIAKSGLSSLTPDERALLPSGFTLGNDLYLERFKEAMGEHVPAEMVSNYFAAQSTWDEVMADTATQFLKSHPEQTLVIIVGDFHAQYGGGLPDRLKARGAAVVKVISQVDVTGLTDAEKRELIQPHVRWGKRADYVWISKTK